MDSYYNWFKAAHVIFVITWMAGMFYLPRLFVYHTRFSNGSENDLLFQQMERRLMKIIINPSMILSFVFGIIVAYIYGFGNLGMWFHIKMFLVLIMAAMHGFLSICRKKFINGKNMYSEKFYRMLNEIPTILMVGIVILVIVKPFE
jgi:putative membrane protein